MKELEIVTRLSAWVPKTICWRPIRAVYFHYFGPLLSTEMTVKTYSDMVDPDQIAVVEGDGVATPHVLRVDIGDGNVSVVGFSNYRPGLKEAKEKLTG